VAVEKNTLKRSTFSVTKLAFSLISVESRKRALFSTVFLVFVGILDLMGVAIIGALGALSIQAIEINDTGRKVNLLLNIINIQNFDIKVQILFLSLIAGFLFLLKTVISVTLTKKIYFFLSNENTFISSSLFSKILSQDYISLQKQNSQHLLYIATEGVRSMIFGILATFLSVIVDFSLLIIIIFGLILVDPLIAIGMIILFGFTAIFLNISLKSKSLNLGIRIKELTINSNEIVLQVLNSYKEAYVKNQRSYYSSEFLRIRRMFGNSIAESSLMPYISKYFIESVVVIGMLAIICLQFVTKSPTYAVASITVFVAASARIAPAVLRIQQSFLSISQNIGSANSTIDLIEELKFIQPEMNPDFLPDFLPDFVYKEFESDVNISDLTFQYSKDSNFLLTISSLNIPAGTSVAFIGPSGSGKTTLVDLILGVLKPTSGSIKISGRSPEETISKWPGAVAYVPQNIFIANGTIRDNISLGYPLESFSEDLVRDAIEFSGLKDFIQELPNSLNTLVGESGNQISGGQRQRIGIARALIMKPRILILDEATSSLDINTEKVVTNYINLLYGKVTTIFIAHRLSTIKNVDQVVYIEDGKVLVVGNYSHVKNHIEGLGKKFDSI
jgi:ABC-type multidrug transport system fused ATPase/permease subunit